MNASNPAVSVVMPVYNQERYIAEAVEGILRQSFTDFEFIIVDDGSTDATLNVLATYDDPRIRLIRAKHGGFLKALERGVLEARGQWVARMDSDDLCSPLRLARQIEFLTGHPECVFVGSVYGLVTPGGKFLRPVESFDWHEYTASDITLGKELFADPSVVFDRQKELEVGLYDTEVENEKPLWYKLLTVGRAANLGEPLYYARWRIGSHSRTNVLHNKQINNDIRHKYDPQNAAQMMTAAAGAPGKAEIGLAARGFDYYLLAGDQAAAWRVAIDCWKAWPAKPESIKLLVKALLNKRTLGNPSPPPQFIPVERPW